MMGGHFSRFSSHEDPYVGDMVFYAGPELAPFPMYHGPIPPGHCEGCEFCQLFLSFAGYLPDWICDAQVQQPVFHAGA